MRGQNRTGDEREGVSQLRRVGAWEENKSRMIVGRGGGQRKLIGERDN